MELALLVPNAKGTTLVFTGGCELKPVYLLGLLVPATEGTTLVFTTNIVILQTKTARCLGVHWIEHLTFTLLLGCPYVPPS